MCVSIAKLITWKSYSLVLMPSGSTARYLLSRHPKPKERSGNLLLAYSTTLWIAFIVSIIVIDTLFMLAYKLYSALSPYNLAPNFNIYSYVLFQSWMGSLKNSNIKSCFNNWNGGRLIITQLG